MINPFGPLRHVNLWSIAVFKDGDGDGGDDDAGFQGPNIDGTAGYQQDTSSMSVDSSTGFISGSDGDGGGYQGPTLDSGPGYQQDTSGWTTDSDTGFITSTGGGDDDQFQGPTLSGPGYTQDTSSATVDTDTGFITSFDDAGDDDTFTYQGPTLDSGPGYTQDTSQISVDTDTGFITGTVDDSGSYVPDFSTPTVDVTATPIADLMPPTVTSTGIQTVQPQVQAVQPQLTGGITSVAQPTRAPDDGFRAPISTSRTPTTQTRAPDDGFRDTTPGVTTAQETFESIYGYDPLDITTEDMLSLSAGELADLALATGRTDLFSTNPDIFMPPQQDQTAVLTGTFPQGTPGSQPQDIYMSNEVRTILEASPEAQRAYQAAGFEPFRAGDVGVRFGGQQVNLGEAINYRDAQGNVYSQAEVLDILRERGAPQVTVPGGYELIEPLDITTPTIPAQDIGLSTVDIATPVTITPSIPTTPTPSGIQPVVAGPTGGGGGGGGGGGTPGPDDGFRGGQASPSTAGLTGFLEQSPTIGQPATSVVETAYDIVVPGVETTPTVSEETPDLVTPEGEDMPEVDITVPSLEEVGGTPEETDVTEVEVDTGVEDTGLGRETDTGEGRGTADGETGADDVEVVIDEGDGGGGGEGTGDGAGTGTGTGEGAGEGTGGGEGTGEGTGTGSGTGEGTGSGTGGGEGDGEGTGVGDGTGDGTGTGEEDEDETPVEEEPGFECPEGYEKVMMANGGFTCVPIMERPRVGPYTRPVDVSSLSDYTPIRPGSRRS